MSKYILVTGGAGYIGSHTVISLVNAGYTPVIVDSFVNASSECLKRLETIVGQPIILQDKVDLLDIESLENVFKTFQFIAVIHFAALKAVGESVEKPLLYYKNNIIGTLNLLDVMCKFSVKNIVFSSSATVYGKAQYLPLDEKHPVGQGITNPYGQTKYFMEQIFSDLYRSDSSWNMVLLRYFNPVGAHHSGLIGEDPRGPPANLMPFVAQVAVGRRDKVKVYGGDYDTPDGTGVRDYIHVVDLAEGHLSAMNKLFSGDCGLKIYNLGSGKGYSVLEMINALKEVSGKPIPYEVVDRRAGDLPSIFADTKLAERELNWKAKKGLKDMCKDLWRWQSQNPEGF